LIHKLRLALLERSDGHLPAATTVRA
jgi:hypothetical protein